MSDRLVTGAWRRGLSTLGCLELDLHDVGRLARDHGVEGIELRVGLVPLPPAEAIRAAFDAHGVKVFAIASSVRIADPDGAEELPGVLELAAELGASYVRVFPGGDSAAVAARHVDTVAHLLDRPRAAVIAVETHDHLPTGRAVAGLVARVGHPRVGAIWDVVHPWRHGEPLAETADALLGLPGYVQVKDARSLDDPTPCLLGTGAVPLEEFRSELLARHYHGWVSIEWERAWYPDVPPLAAVLTDPAGW